MITLYQNDQQDDGRHSSKGNQLKWMTEDTWYKADYTGYEGIAEYVISHLLQFSDMKPSEYILYETEEIQYAEQIYKGCKSRNFLKPGWRLFTLERLFQNAYGESLNSSIYHIESLEGRIRFLVEQTERITAISDFGKYMSKMATIDALFLNEDRHTHNMAVLMDEQGSYHLCPFFDHGAALLSDTTMDYPLGGEMYSLIDQVKSKTFCQDFSRQLEQIELLYGQQIKFRFTEKDIQTLLDTEVYYPSAIKERIMNILLEQKRKYKYLFS